jgi:hypothetical protein
MWGSMNWHWIHERIGFLGTPPAIRLLGVSAEVPLLPEYALP